ncbi:hypothetical protein ACFL5X_03855, partial [Candidatus Omnitrophota bacterium]
DYYAAYKADKYANKELADVYGQIKMLIFKDKQIAAVQEWSESLKHNATIEIDYDQLGITPE